MNRYLVWFCDPVIGHAALRRSFGADNVKSANIFGEEQFIVEFNGSRGDLHREIQSHGVDCVYVMKTSKQ